MSLTAPQTALPEGFLLIDKPAGITSFGVIARLRRVTGVRRMGHAGTLDPFATGLLIVGVGRTATRRLGEFLGQPKTYEAVAVLGATSTTQDKDGVITTVAGTDGGAAIPVQHRVETPGMVQSVPGWPPLRQSSMRMPTEDEIRVVIPRFIGEIQQTPPMFSAKKIDGKRLYELAREGKEVERKSVTIKVYEFEVLKYDAQSTQSTSFPKLTFRVRASAGTYVRTLAHDLGAALGTGAYLEELRRTKIGEYRVEDATALDVVTQENWQSLLGSL